MMAERDRLPSFLPLDGQIDMADAKLAEQKTSAKKMRNSHFKWLVFIFFMAYARLFIYNLV